MGDFLWLGTLLGAVAGSFHSLQFIRSHFGRARGRGHYVKAIWHGVWIFALWTLLAAYVLAFWLLGGLLYIITRPFGREKVMP